MLHIFRLNFDRSCYEIEKFSRELIFNFEYFFWFFFVLELPLVDYEESIDPQRMNWSRKEEILP